MDALSDVLRVAQLTGGVFLHAEFFAPWCIAARLSPEHCAPVLGPASDLIIYHYIVEGDVRIRIDGEPGEDVTLGPGDVALLPRNDLHLLAVNNGDVWHTIRYASGTWKSSFGTPPGQDTQAAFLAVAGSGVR